MPRNTGRSGHPVALIAARYELVREVRVDQGTVEWDAFDVALDRPVLVQLLRPRASEDSVATERFWEIARAAAQDPRTAGERVLDAGTDPETGQPFVVREWSAPPRRTRRFVQFEPAAAALSALLDQFSRLEARSRWVAIASVLAVALILLAGVLRPGVEGWLAWVNEPLARSSSDRSASSPPAPAPRSTQPAASPAPTPVPTPPPTPTSEAGQSRRIVNTDGRGVALRASPGGERMPGRGYDEGAPVRAFEQSGEWTRIRGSDGREGWVLSVTLAP